LALLDVQRALARLYTDEVYRGSAFGDGSDATRSSLGTEEAGWLETLDRTRVERYARSLRRKRMRLVRDWVPLIGRSMGEVFATVFNAYARENPSVPTRPLDDAMGFLDFLRQSGLQEPTYLPDLVRCEYLRLRVMRAEDKPSPGLVLLSDQSVLRLTPRATVELFSFDVAWIRARLANGESVDAIQARCWILVGRPLGASDARVTRIEEASARLLALCDGTRTLGEMLGVLAAEAGLAGSLRPRLAWEATDFLHPLVAHGLLTAG